MPAIRQRRFPLRWYLPVGQLCICAFLLLPEIPFIAFQVQSAAAAYWPRHQRGAITRQLPTVRVVDPALVPVVPNPKFLEARIALPTVINLPAFFVGASVWRPKGMLPSYWRAISFPFIGIGLWFVAGRGLEGFQAARRRMHSPTITWIEFGISVFITIGCMMLCAGLLADPSIRKELVLPWPAAFVSSAMWILLGGSAITGRLMQWRIGRAGLP